MASCEMASRSGTVQGSYQTIKNLARTSRFRLFSPKKHLFEDYREADNFLPRLKARIRPGFPLLPQEALMIDRRVRLLCGLLFMVCLCAGCEGWGGGQETADAESEYSIDGDESVADSEGAKQKESQTAEASTPAEAVAAIPPAGDQKPQSLKLNLKVGDRFPLIKSVTQVLYQEMDNKRAKSQSLLELTMSLSLEEFTEANERKFGVTYHRVRFQQDLLGKTVQFDSQVPADNVPAEAVPYQGLVNNGFSFWIGSNNQINKVEGFQQFLDRCLSAIPAERRAQARAMLSVSSGSEGIANFIDDTIGLLPPSQVKIGDHWSLTQHRQQPVPFDLTTRYSLQGLNDNIAEINILGSISNPAPAETTAAQKSKINMTVRGGQHYGSCTIDRRTGLPINSQINQEIAMRVKLPSGKEFDQRKQTITIIRAFPAQETAVGAIYAPEAPNSKPANTGAIRQTSGTSLPGKVTHAVDAPTASEAPQDGNDAADLQQSINVQP